MSETFGSLRLSGNARLDALDARTRVLAAFAAIVCVLVLRSPLALLCALAISLALIPLAGLSIGRVLRRLAHVEGFLVILVVLLPFTVAGAPIAHIGPLALSQEGLHLSVLLLLRANLSILILFTLLSGMEPVSSAHALARLGVPAKLVHLVLFSARYVTLIGEEARRLHDSLRARAFVPRTSRHTARTLAHFFGQLLVKALERAERVDEAMRCRAFNGRFPLLSTSTFGARDAAFVGLLACALALILLADRIA
ncbi:cobalt ECF transporter T component CbiQ [Consotaella salsifontis]|uniref:Cobalt/nickel transport system permease protein n=1 Tax=Consotaella salsifontis TaxID=1365950 RepID=A0A1T4NZ31_9HYPH|nr:cobalt ECF transporter T component CbiQ [Consotaella salsifontis]SJZ84286.1 cobalt/nickel transport system permease protein [Consotaella salsifontis]